MPNFSLGGCGSSQRSSVRENNLGDLATRLAFHNKHEDFPSPSSIFSLFNVNGLFTSPSTDSREKISHIFSSKHSKCEKKPHPLQAREKLKLLLLNYKYAYLPSVTPAVLQYGINIANIVVMGQVNNDVPDGKMAIVLQNNRWKGG